MCIKHAEFDENSDIFTVSDRKLVSTTRGDVVYPEDELYYHFKVNNLSDKSVKVNYTLEKSKGGEIEEPIKTGYFVAKPNVEYPYSINELFLNDEGSYKLKLTLDLLFFDNITYDPENTEEDDSFKLNFDPPADKIDVLSHADKLQADVNNYNLYGIIFAGVIGIGTVLALIANVRYSRSEVSHLANQNVKLDGNIEIQKQVESLNEQNTIIRQQFSEQNRPWISIADVEKKNTILDQLC